VLQIAPGAGKHWPFALHAALSRKPHNSLEDPQSESIEQGVAASVPPASVGGLASMHDPSWAMGVSV
jgi:hypothetical protein